MSTLLITPLSNKTAYVTGMIVAGEPCDITLTGLAHHITTPNSLRIRVRVKGVDVAVFPAEVSDVWLASSDDATGTLDTNTVEALAAFGSGNCAASVECTVLVEKITAPKELFCSFTANLKYWPPVVGVDAPHNLATWPDGLAAAVAATEALQAEYDAHNHAEGDPTQVDHDDVLNNGTVSHTDLEAAITAIEGDVSAAEGNIGTLQSDMDAAEALMAVHNHNGDTSQQLSHAGLTGIGTRTHDQLESDTADVDAKVNENKLAYDEHAHTGTDGTPQVAIGSVLGWAAMLARLEAAEAAVIALTAALEVLDAAAVKKSVTAYTVTAPEFGTYRNISEDMTGDELARSIPTIVADLQAKGVL
jgi:hypothetical protein